MVDTKILEEIVVEIRLKLQTKGFASNRIHEFLFQPYYPEAEISIKSLKHLFDINGINNNKAQQLARYLIELREVGNKPSHYSEDLTGSHS